MQYSVTVEIVIMEDYLNVMGKKCSLYIQVKKIQNKGIV